MALERVPADIRREGLSASFAQLKCIAQIFVKQVVSLVWSVLSLSGECL